jgi:hypothetical protein
MSSIILGKGISYPQDLCRGGPTDVQVLQPLDNNLTSRSDFLQCCVKGGGKASSGGNLPGLNATQSRHAHRIIAVAKSMDMPVRGCQVAMATALQESTIHIYANSAGVPASMDCLFDPGYIGQSRHATSSRSSSNTFSLNNEVSDQDSVGIFQQRVSIYGDGDVCNPMNPTTSAGYFFEALNRISGWESMPIGVAAQAVQHSEFPGRYQKWASKATNICTAGY